ncbi:hypothetical protein F441_23012 [Phytophthora nicotianae CJ01A1]|uniref:Uncharacterized protein n=2 Tax=Phytophthora nicotianae TaxID=4792 RepID=W2VPH0_PHYNI|nr:hypothetical protein F444_22611 [Phytophthora nicotianae P1976]ETO99572.1 hypothetical protein F441_23012 [Phytophthora nicotianae CJ01A1]
MEAYDMRTPAAVTEDLHAVLLETMLSDTVC